MVDTDHSEFAIREGAALALGLALATSPEGARVEQVLENRPASDAGIREGDVIRKVAGEIALTADRVFEVLDKFRPRSEVELSVLREGREATLLLILPEPLERGFDSQDAAPVGAAVRANGVRLKVARSVPDVVVQRHNEERLRDLLAETSALRARIADQAPAAPIAATTGAPVTGTSVTVPTTGLVLGEATPVGLVHLGGVYGAGSVAGTAFSAALHGHADVIRARGQSSLLWAQAARHYQEARSRALDNAVKALLTRQALERTGLAWQAARSLELKEAAARLAARRAIEHRSLYSESEPELRAWNRLFLARRLIDEGLLGAARGWLEDIVEQYPGTAAAAEAGDLLARL
jgi:hypothetical protein